MMMKRLATFLLFSCSILILKGCKEKFAPEVSAENKNLLVVEGVINTGNDSTIIKLSRSTIVEADYTVNPEIGALVSVESNSNETFPLKEIVKGVYGAAPLNLSSTKKYRLNIKTSSGATYQSDFVDAKVSPPIDSVSWKIKADGVDFFVNTHDASNQTKYYRWEYVETWAFYSKYYSIKIFDPALNYVRNRNFPEEEAYKCYANHSSSAIYMGSSAKLNKDVIFEAPLHSVESTSEKFGERYSVLVKQYALTLDAYNFWTQLKKNTESLGSIFDPQPSDFQSNIHNVNDPKEPVIGYISACKVEQKRIYIARDQLPRSPAWVLKYPVFCGQAADTVLSKDIFSKFKGSEKIYIPIEPAIAPNGDDIGLLASSAACVDCRTRGSNKKPAFWP
ncbi:MAG: DUF4249 domain-containing protein [Chitinophagaceae bacterium]|nr:MAG: DUF4249 domain-containing protein [Chitinophagaceae bacterium]